MHVVVQYSDGINIFTDPPDFPIVIKGQKIEKPEPPDGPIFVTITYDKYSWL